MVTGEVALIAKTVGWAKQSAAHANSRSRFFHFAPDGTPSVDIVASLRRVLGDEADAARQEARLYAQVGPLVDALLPDSAQTQMPQA